MSEIDWAAPDGGESYGKSNDMGSRVILRLRRHLRNPKHIINISTYILIYIQRLVGFRSRGDFNYVPYVP